MGKLSVKGNAAFKKPPTVRVLMATRDGELLFLKRAEHKKNPGSWDLPGGGVDPGESYDEAAWRETQEETGIFPDRMARIAEQDMDDRRCILYVAVIDEATTPLLDREHVKAKWKDGLDAMPSNMHPRTEALIEGNFDQLERIVNNLVKGKRLKKMGYELALAG